jgi:hypothetical protein
MGRVTRAMKVIKVIKMIKKVCDGRISSASWSSVWHGLAVQPEKGHPGLKGQQPKIVLLTTPLYP